MSQITHKKGVRYQYLNCQSPRPDSCCKQIKRIFGQVLDAAIGLLARTSRSQIRGSRRSGFCFLLKAGEFCVQGHSNGPEPAFAKRTHFHRIHTRHDTTARHQFIHHLDTGFSWFPCVSKANAEMFPKIPSCHYTLLM